MRGKVGIMEASWRNGPLAWPHALFPDLSSIERGKNLSPSVERKLICWSTIYDLLPPPSLSSSPSVVRKNNSCINSFHIQGGLAAGRASGHKTSASTPVYATSPVVRRHEIWRSGISGKPSKLCWSAEKWRKTMMMIMMMTQKRHYIVMLTVIYQACALAPCIIAHWTKINNIFMNWKTIDGELH